MDIPCELMGASTFAFKYDRELVNTIEEHGYGSGNGAAGGSLDCLGILSACATCIENYNCSGKAYMIKSI